MRAFMSKGVMRIVAIVLVFGCSLITGCQSLQKPDKVVKNVSKLLEHNTYTVYSEYEKYISDLEKWADMEAYDALLEVPEEIRKIDENVDKVDTSVSVQSMKFYACSDKPDLEEVYNTIIFEEEEAMREVYENDELDKKAYSKWNKKLKKMFNPGNIGSVEEANYYIAYGYYNLTWDNIDFRYFIVVLCDSEGKVIDFEENQL